MPDKKNPIQAFDFKGQQVRTLASLDDLPWFAAADVCKALAITNVSQAINGNPSHPEGQRGGLDADEKRITTVYTPSGDQEMLVINESGLYSLIFKSRKAEAKAFKKWVTSEVLPTLRKTSRYEMAASQAAPTDEAVARAFMLAVESYRAEIADLRKLVERLNVVNQLPNKTMPAGWDRLVNFAAGHGIILHKSEVGGEASVCKRACKALGIAPLRYQFKERGFAINLYPIDTVLNYWLASYRRRNGFKSLPVLPLKD